MLKLIIFGIAFIIIGFVIERYLKEKFSIPKRSLIYKPVNRTHLIIEILVFVGYIFTAIMVGFNFPGFNILNLIAPFLIFISLIRAMMEWTYDRVSNQWILSLFTAILIFALWIAIILSGVFQLPV